MAENLSSLNITKGRRNSKENLSGDDSRNPEKPDDKYEKPIDLSNTNEKDNKNEPEEVKTFEDNNTNQTGQSNNTEYQQHDKDNNNKRNLLEEEEKEAEIERRNYINEYFHALGPFLLFSNVFSRFPIQLNKKNKDGIYIFSYNGKSIPAIIFLCLHIFVMIVSIIISCNCFGLLLNFPRHEIGGVTGKDPNTARAEELFIFKRNLAPLVIFLSSLFHTNIGNWNFFLKRNYAVTYLNFWPEAIKILRFNAAAEIYKSMVWIIGFYCIFLILMVLIVLIRIAPVTSGFPGLISMLLVRVFNPSFYASNPHYVFKAFISIFILYIFIAAKTYPLLFIIKCKLLRNCFTLWNRRLDIILNKGDEYFPKEISDSMTDRISFPDLFRGHVVILELIEGNDELFGEIIESYLGSQITSLVFELYYFYRAQQGSEEFTGSRSLDSIVIGLVLAQNVVFLCYVVFSATNVNIEAMDGLEIIRRKGFIGKRSNDELYFILSMYTSFTGHFETAINAAGYFVYNKTYIVVIFGAIATYLIIFMQFKPPLDLVDAKLRPMILSEDRLIKFVEDTANLFPSSNIGALMMDALGLNNTTNQTLNSTIL